MKLMTSQDRDQVSMISNMFGFSGYLQMKQYKAHKTAINGLLGFGLVFGTNQVLPLELSQYLLLFENTEDRFG